MNKGPLFFILQFMYILRDLKHSNKPHLKIRIHSTEKLLLNVHVVLAINTCQDSVNSNFTESEGASIILSRLFFFNAGTYFATPNT